MKNLVGKKAVYTSPYTGINVEITIAKYQKNSKTVFDAILSTNGAYYPLYQLKIL